MKKITDLEQLKPFTLKDLVLQKIDEETAKARDMEKKVRVQDQRRRAIEAGISTLIKEEFEDKGITDVKTAELEPKKESTKTSKPYKYNWFQSSGRGA